MHSDNCTAADKVMLWDWPVIPCTGTAELEISSWIVIGY